MTVRDTLLSFFRANLNTSLNPIQISRITGLNRNTVRREMQELIRDTEFIKRVERGVYESVKSTHAYVYRWKGYRDNKIVYTTYTSDHKLIGTELKAIAKQATEGQGNASLMSEGETDMSEADLYFGYDVEEVDY